MKHNYKDILDNKLSINSYIWPNHKKPFEFIEEYMKVIRKLDFVIGEHVWNFADFSTKQGLTRINGNKKGVFSRERQPKMIAHWLKKNWE